MYPIPPLRPFNQHYAARNGHMGLCAMLIEHGASVNAQTNGTHTHTHTHTHTCTHTRTHTLFLTPSTCTGGATPLHRAAYSGHTDIAQLLINSGADVRLVDSDGKTALHKVDTLHTCSPLGLRRSTLEGYLH